MVCGAIAAAVLTSGAFVWIMAGEMNEGWDGG